MLGQSSSVNGHPGSTRFGERGFVLPTAGVLFICVIPLVGLVLDVGILYTVQSKLSAAVDAGALAGARSLSRGSDAGTQTANAQSTASSYVNANFPTGYFFSTNLNVPTPTVDTSQANVRSVTVSASVDVPRLFMGWFSSVPTTVRASATATRRDVNVMVVMDRSGSLQQSGSCSPLKAAAIGFVDKFAEGRDNLGLITFASSSLVDFNLNTTFKAGVDNIITNLVCNGATNSPQGLWQGYQTLAALNQPTALNVILFFTDGQPTAVTERFDKVVGNSCVNSQFRGVFTVGFNGSPATPFNTLGFLNWQATAQPMASDQNAAPEATGCYSVTPLASHWGSAIGDIQGVKTQDYWGNNLNNGYQTVTLSNGFVVASSDSTGALNMVHAATNATDDAAARIRTAQNPNNGASALPNIVIFSIGLGNSTYPANDDLLERVANDPRSSSFDSSKQVGLYVYAPSAADLSNAFTRVASEILRLAK